MLSSIRIEKYRNVKLLEISGLSRVNLFVGKNNTGKTSVLEAISILAINSDSNMDYNVLTGWIYKIIYNRDSKSFIVNDPLRNDFTELNLQILNSLISDRKNDYFDGFNIIGKENENHRFGPGYYSEGVKLHYIPIIPRHISFVDKEGNNQMRFERVPVTFPQELENELTPRSNWEKIAYLHINHDEMGYGRPIEVISRSGDIMANALNKIYRRNVQFVTTKELDEDISLILYDRIIFEQYKMDQVHNALRLIEPSLEKFAFQTNDSGQRIGRIKLSSNSDLVSIGNMGDGMNRILNIILAAVNCQNGYLFIDEFENGLHYSVQKHLWEILLFLSETLNIQIFATTHSNDTIKSLSDVLDDKKDSAKIAKAFRLQRDGEKIYAIGYNENELETSSDFGIEIR